MFLDQHGEVCPAGWKPGGATVIFNIFSRIEEVVICINFFSCRLFRILMRRKSILRRLTSETQPVHDK